MLPKMMGEVANMLQVRVDFNDIENDATTRAIAKHVSLSDGTPYAGALHDGQEMLAVDGEGNSCDAVVVGVSGQKIWLRLDMACFQSSSASHAMLV